MGLLCALVMHCLCCAALCSFLQILIEVCRPSSVLLSSQGAVPLASVLCPLTSIAICCTRSSGAFAQLAYLHMIGSLLCQKAHHTTLWNLLLPTKYAFIDPLASERSKTGQSAESQKHTFGVCPTRDSLLAFL